MDDRPRRFYEALHDVNAKTPFPRRPVDMDGYHRAEPGIARGPLVTVAVSPGELFDKISILEIKARRIGDPQKLRNVQFELEMLTEARDRLIPARTELTELTTELRLVNELLWDVEDAIRCCERNGDFGPNFIDLARSVYINNDRRAAIKRQINELLGSRLIEEKSF
jgi:hypothetical protein